MEANFYAVCSKAVEKIKKHFIISISEKSDLRPINLSEVRLHKTLIYNKLSNQFKVFFLLLDKILLDTEYTKETQHFRIVKSEENPNYVSLCDLCVSKKDFFTKLTLSSYKRKD